MGDDDLDLVNSHGLSRRSHPEASWVDNAAKPARRSSFLDSDERRKSGPLVYYSDVKIPVPCLSKKNSPRESIKRSQLELDKSPSKLSDACGSSSTNSFGIDMDTSLRMHDSLSQKVKGDEREVYDLRGLLFLLFVTGILGSIIGLVGGIFHKVVVIAREKLRVGIGEPLHDQSPYLMYAAMTLACILSAVAVGIITQKYCPECIGGGMIATRICVSLGAPLRFEVVLYRFVLSVIYMGGGNPLGAEAPTLHICAALAGSINGFFSKLFPSLLNLETMPQIVLIGCVAGLAQAFHTPLGALIFALEEFDFVRRSHVTFVLISACAVPAVLVSTGLKNVLSSSGNAALFSIPPPAQLQSLMDQSKPWMLFTLSTFAGITMAFAAEMFNQLVMRSRGKMEAFIHGTSSVASSLRRNVIVVAASALLVGISGVVVIQVMDKLVGVKCDAYRSSCPDPWGIGEMTMSAFSRFLAFSASSDEKINRMGECNLYGEKSYWHRPEEWSRPNLQAAVRQTYSGMMIVGMIKMIIIALAAAAGGSGGMFAPALTLGGLLGGGTGMMFCSLLEYISVIDEFHLELLGQLSFFFGMVGFFTGTHRLPLTAAICVFELTTYAESENCLRMPANTLVTCILFPSLWTSVVSFTLSLYLNPDSLLERMIEQDGFARDDMSYSDESEESQLRTPPSINQSASSLSSLPAQLSRTSSFADSMFNSRKQSALQGVARAHAEFANNNPSLLNKILNHAKPQDKRDTVKSQVRRDSFHSSLGSLDECSVRHSVDDSIDEEKEWQTRNDQLRLSHSTRTESPPTNKLIDGIAKTSITSYTNNFLKGKKFNMRESKQTLKSVGSNVNTSTMRMYRNAVQSRAPSANQSRSNSISGFPQKDHLSTPSEDDAGGLSMPKTSQSFTGMGCGMSYTTITLPGTLETSINNGVTLCAVPIVNEQIP